jgi:threonine/homoserine/homoserine lactone efflux protein
VPEPSTVAVFSLAALILLVVPGPSVLYIVTRSIDQGRLAGLVSVLGIQTGALVHIAAATLGVSALLVSSALAFSLVKYAGAAYLIFLGIRRIFFDDDARGSEERATPQLSSIYRQGVVVNALNPKTALFFFAFLPQFVDTGNPAAPQILFLGAVFIAIALLSDGTYALVSASAGDWLRKSATFAGVRRYVSGAVFTLLGLTAALSGSRAESG